MRLLIIECSVREGRAGENVTNWFVEFAKDYGKFDVEKVDLLQLGLSYELPAQMPGQVKDGLYSRKEDKDWAKMVSSADAVAFVSPEYNHGYPASLKNAIDHLYLEWVNKPVTFVGYGSAGAQFAYQAFELVASRLQMKLTKNRVAINKIWEAFDDKGRLLKSSDYEDQASKALYELVKQIEKQDP